MRRLFLSVVLGVLAGCAGALAQTQTRTDHYRSGFLKDLTVESFGYDLSPTGQGFESPIRFTNTPMLSEGLECPRCIVRPAMERSRFTLPPLGAQATLPVARDRAELFTGFGGINAWKPDNTTIEHNRRDRSFNDAWLMQGNVGAKFAVDHNRHIWLGPVGRYVSNFGAGKKHWNTVGGSATFQLPH